MGVVWLLKGELMALNRVLLTKLQVPPEVSNLSPKGSVLQNHTGVRIRVLSVTVGGLAQDIMPTSHVAL